MALRLIRRHLKDCPHTSTKYRRCKCPIHVYGTLAGERIRKALDQTSWEAASELITAWTAAGEIGVVKAEAPTITSTNKSRPVAVGTPKESAATICPMCSSGTSATSVTAAVDGGSRTSRPSPD
jgi:hypothetical protein